jgi:hypothetical protein
VLDGDEGLCSVDCEHSNEVVKDVKEPEAAAAEGLLMAANAAASESEGLLPLLPTCAGLEETETCFLLFLLLECSSGRRSRAARLTAQKDSPGGTNENK